MDHRTHAPLPAYIYLDAVEQAPLPGGSVPPDATRKVKILRGTGHQDNGRKRESQIGFPKKNFRTGRRLKRVR